MSLTDIISQTLQNRFHLDLYQDSKTIADCVLKTSDYYIKNPNHSTPWEETWCQIAQLGYYLPLNYERTQAALTRPGVDLGHIDTLIDFGCGLSPISWYFYFNLNRPFDVYLLDQSLIPIQLLKEMGLKIKEVITLAGCRKKAPSKNVLTSCSYVLTELHHQKEWQWLLDCHNLFILEPSLAQDARNLMAFRTQLLNHSFFIQAPCPHSKPCPLLTHSKTDWCHDRTSVTEFPFLSSIESFLPFYNHSVTFSYLIASRQPSAYPSKARVIGDTLFEKGKSKQAICYNDNRTFLTWMEKDWKSVNLEKIPRGSLIEIPEIFVTKGTSQNLELRVTPKS